MKTSTAIWAVIIIIVIAGAAWYFVSYSNNPAAPYTAPTTDNTDTTGGTPATGATGTAIITTSSNAPLGTFAVASNGMTLYTYSPDTPGVSNCSGQCAANWPPYTVAAGTSLSANGLTGAVATITRADGSTQVTYKGAPVYFYTKDTKPGDTNGQGVGGVWYVVKP